MRVIIRQPNFDDLSIELPDRPLTEYMQLDAYPREHPTDDYKQTDAVPEQWVTFHLIGNEQFAGGVYPVYERLL
jgi:hypothetical protein